jgi:hypothetical protein
MTRNLFIGFNFKKVAVLGPHYIASRRPQQKTPFPINSYIVIEFINTGFLDFVYRPEF